MPRFDPAEFGRMRARLIPQELRQAEGLVAEAPKRAKAALEINARDDAGGPASSCPRCGGDTRLQWGRTIIGAQRWHCSGCGGTPLARVHRPSVVAPARDMIKAPQPMSCRRVAEVLRALCESIWRWQLAIIGALTPKADHSLAGIVKGCHRSAVAHRVRTDGAAIGTSETRWQRSPSPREPKGGRAHGSGTGATLPTTQRRRV